MNPNYIEQLAMLRCRNPLNEWHNAPYGSWYDEQWTFEWKWLDRIKHRWKLRNQARRANLRNRSFSQTWQDELRAIAAHAQQT